MVAETGLLVILNKESGAVEGWCDDFEEMAGMLQPGAVATVSAFRLGPIYRSFELSGGEVASESRTSLRGHANGAQRPA
ncbi:MAG TPA: hypothetical protein VMT20_29910 [Terriglobia bacterium]|nr:hypothetical protein [Terriglobia bacterium]